MLRPLHLVGKLACPGRLNTLQPGSWSTCRIRSISPPKATVVVGFLKQYCPTPGISTLAHAT
jgi:hypothetical protein